MTNILILVAIGLAAGVLSGLLGIGGGIIIIPALIFFCGFTQIKAQGTSLAILLPPVGILGFIEYYKHGNVDVKAAIVICIALLIGAAFGARIVHLLPASTLKKVFATFLLLISVKMFLGK